MIGIDVTRDTILVTEDQAIIAMALQQELEDLGYEVAGPFATCSQAEEWLRTNTPALAILDVQLRDGPCIKVAQELERRGVRTIVFSGLPANMMPEGFPVAPRFEKPRQLEEMLRHFGSEIRAIRSG